LLATEQINVAAQKQLPEVMQIHFFLSREFRVLSCFETLADAAKSGSQVFKKCLSVSGCISICISADASSNDCLQIFEFEVNFSCR
jgi:hypothetical protein